MTHPRSVFGRRAARLALWATLALAAPALADQIVVVTSFPKELTEAYKRAYEAKFPGDKVEILNKNTNAGIAYVRELPPGNRPDVFWASAPDAFEVLSRGKLLAKFVGGNKDIPAKIGSYPTNDPDGLYYGQAASGYGLMWNTRYLRANKLAEPREWVDLVKPEYFGHVALSSPSRSGTTHLTVETILQGEGWKKGWEQILMICGNAATISERSFGVPDGVNSGQFGIGLVIDFFGLAAKYSGFPVDFVYPAMTAVVPANIALIEGAKSPEGAKRFIQYTLSEEGQALMLDPKISRLPVLEKTYAKAPKGYPNVFEIARRAKVNFNSDLSESRYYLVTSLFDQLVTFRLKELNAATKAIHTAGAALARKPNAKGSALLAQARELAYTVPVDEQKTADKAYLAQFRAEKKDPAATKRLAALEEQFNSQARANYLKAVELAEQAAATAR